MIRFACILSIFLVTADKVTNHRLSFKIEDHSTLSLSGKTNVNTFDCNCTDKFPASILEAEFNETTGSLHFKNTSIQIKATALNCKKYLMTKDMHKALKADKFPFITVELLEATAMHTEKTLEPGRFYPYTANTSISIAGITKPQKLIVRVQRLSDHLIKFSACKDISMKDYEIKPKTPLNVVKIDDKVSINFEMTVILSHEL